MEQVLDARGFVADLLACTSRPRIPVTSRSPLDLSWEQEFPVPPLGVPGRGSIVSAASVAGCESGRLSRPGRPRRCPALPSPQRTRPRSRESGNASTAAAGDRTGGGVDETVAACDDPGAAGALPGAAGQRAPGCAGSAADAARHDRLEPRAVDRGGEAAAGRVFGLSRWHRPGRPRGRLRRGGRPARTCVTGLDGVGRPQPAPAGGYRIGVGQEVRDVGGRPRVRGRAVGGAAWPRAGASGACVGVLGPGHGPGPSAVVAGSGRPGPART